MDEYGPPLPPGYKREDSSEEEDNVVINKSEKFIGPQYPAFLSKRKNEDDEEKYIGPALPPGMQNENSEDDESDLELPGPIPNHCNNDESIDDVIVSIEKRATKMKDKLNNNQIPAISKVEREEWMICPDTSSKGQFGAISRCLAPPKRQSDSMKEILERKRCKERDKEITDELKKYNKSRRGESLMDMHKKSRKEKEKEKKASSKPKERKPFDRDEMAVRHFTKDQVASVINKSKYLNSRFASGSSQYL